MGGDCTTTLAMVLVQVGFAGLNVVSKLALDDGMSPYVMIAYRQIVATLFISPIAFFLERATMNQLLYSIGLQYSTPTIASALNNMLPAITFIMAVPFRYLGARELDRRHRVLDGFSFGVTWANTRTT